MPLADEVEVKLGRPDVGENGVGGNQLAAGQPDTSGPATLDVDRCHRGVQRQTPAVVVQPSYQRVDDGAGAPFRDREPDALCQHAQQPAVDRAARSLRCQIGVQGVAREQQRAALAGELLVAVTAHGLHGEAREAQQLRRSQPPGEAQRRPHRRERPQDRVDERLADPLVVLDDAHPGGAVAGRELLQ